MQLIRTELDHPPPTVLLLYLDYSEVDDPDKLWTLGISVFERYTGPYSDELKPFVEVMLHKRVAIKMLVERTVSWDHRKLGLPSTRPGAA